MKKTADLLSGSGFPFIREVENFPAIHIEPTQTLHEQVFGRPEKSKIPKEYAPRNRKKPARKPDTVKVSFWEVRVGKHYFHGTGTEAQAITFARIVSGAVDMVGRYSIHAIDICDFDADFERDGSPKIKEEGEPEKSTGLGLQKRDPERCRDMATMEITVYGSDSDVVHNLPAHKVVCTKCDGEGSVLNPSIAEHAYTAEEFNEEFSDEGDEYDEETGELVFAGSERSQYFQRGGMFDIPCPDCKGKNVVLAISVNALNEEQKAFYALYLKQEEEAQQSRWEQESERRMGA